MKKNLLFIALLAGAASFSQAQQRPQRNSGEMVQGNIEMLDKQLSLTAEQKTQVTAIMVTHSKSMDSLRNTMGDQADRIAMRTKMQESRKENQTKIMSILTDDQKKAYKKYIADRQSRMGNGPGGNGPMANPNN
ncbi:Spy/CpxP family protein refolding chaperone [Arcticibacter eurypsychrophilus]|uniref:Spy/CpxP family protein refolding chaperone n=1 Tax=Arcticibacter eurypsychrophilus TaxID=1434752 RepID=UPI00084DFC96|nr:Spy/CpxP family protein refolding chaperone [Arcticibacter eurypsychrophilus]